MKAASFNRVASCSGDFCPVTWGVPCRGRTQPPQVCVFFWSISRGMVCSLQAFQEVGAPRIGESWRRSGVCGGGPSSLLWRLMAQSWPGPNRPPCPPAFPLCPLPLLVQHLGLPEAALQPEAPQRGVQQRGHRGAGGRRTHPAR